MTIFRRLLSLDDLNANISGKSVVRVVAENGENDVVRLFGVFERRFQILETDANVELFDVAGQRVRIESLFGHFGIGVNVVLDIGIDLQTVVANFETRLPYARIFVAQRTNL